MNHPPASGRQGRALQMAEPGVPGGRAAGPAPGSRSAEMPVRAGAAWARLPFPRSSRFWVSSDSWQLRKELAGYGHQLVMQGVGTSSCLVVSTGLLT